MNTNVPIEKPSNSKDNNNNNTLFNGSNSSYNN
jgi:hypothetical protein